MTDKLEGSTAQEKQIVRVNVNDLLSNEIVSLALKEPDNAVLKKQESAEERGGIPGHASPESANPDCRATHFAH